MTRLLPCYIGSKARWIPSLERFRGARIVEPFAGSAAVSFELAGEALWNEADPVLAYVLDRFDLQEVPDRFTMEDYARVRGRADWWRWTWCLQKLAFASVFRYGPRGFNVPPDRRRGEVSAREEYEAALRRWRELRPYVTCDDWAALPWDWYRGAIVVWDPPFEGSKTAYNRAVDYGRYWRAVYAASLVAEASVVFDYEETLRVRLPDAQVLTRKMRPNAKYAGRIEAMAVMA